VIFAEILAEQFLLAQERRGAAPSRAAGHVREIDAADLKFDRAGNRGLVELAVAGFVREARGVDRVGVDGLGVVDRRVGPRAVHVAIVNVRGPRADVIGMAVGIQLAGVGHRHVAEQEDRLHVRRIGGVVGLDEIFHGHGGIGAIHIVAQHGPAVAGEVLLQARELGGEIRSVSVVDDKDNLAAVLDERNVDARLDVTVAGNKSRHSSRFDIRRRCRRRR